MKKLNFFATLAAAAALTMGVTSCSKDDNGGAGQGDKTPTQLSIKLSGVIQSAPGTKAIEGQGLTAPGTIQLTSGHIFVIDPLGAVIGNEALNVSQATSPTGQLFTGQVPSDSRVYIVGNIPSADQATIAALGSFSAIQAATSLMTTQTDYDEAALANSDGAPASITVNASNNTATVNVSIKPLISRMELVQVKGGTSIKAFDVTGVYVDDYYPSFNYAGGHSGAIVSNNQGTTFAGLGDASTWSATDAVTPGTFIADPQTSGNGDVWAYQVASGALPRFIIELDNIEYEDALNNTVTLSGKHYLTVKSYTSLGSATFERGKIYRIGAANGITFDENDITITPNQVDVDLTVEVSIEEWVLVTPDANL